MVIISNHAQHRQARRNLSDSDVNFVLQHGQRLYCAGVLHIFLGRRNIPGERDVYQRHAHLEDAVLVLHDYGHYFVLITVYRNRQGFRSIKAKAPYDRTRRRPENSFPRLQA